MLDAFVIANFNFLHSFQRLEVHFTWIWKRIHAFSSEERNFAENVNFPVVVNFFYANWENICYRQPFSVEFIQWLAPPT